MNRGIFPRKDAERNAYFKIAVLYLELHADRLKIDNEVIDNLRKLWDQWNIWYDQSLNDELTNKQIVSNKEAASVNLEAMMRIVFGDLPQSKLTLDDRNTLHLEERSTSRTPSPLPSTFPVGKVKFDVRLEHSISFTDQDGKHGKPQGVRGCQIYYKEGEPVLSVKDLHFLATDTASPYLHKFDVDAIGKTIHYWLRWENTRGETGPWSAPVSAVVVG